eukprot:2707285-Rhodomonas_salina.1
MPLPVSYACQCHCGSISTPELEGTGAGGRVTAQVQVWAVPRPGIVPWYRDQPSARVPELNSSCRATR